jgi:hypothetical protein
MVIFHVIAHCLLAVLVFKLISNTRNAYHETIAMEQAQKLSEYRRLWLPNETKTNTDSLPNESHLLEYMSSLLTIAPSFKSQSQSTHSTSRRTNTRAPLTRTPKPLPSMPSLIKENFVDQSGQDSLNEDDVPILVERSEGLELVDLKFQGIKLTN